MPLIHVTSGIMNAMKRRKGDWSYNKYIYEMLRRTNITGAKTRKYLKNKERIT